MRAAFVPLLPLLALLAGAPLVTACASSQPRPAVGLVVRGDEAPAVKRAVISRDMGVDLRVLEAPRASAALEPSKPGAIDVERRLVEARADYMAGELARVRRCAEQLDSPELVWTALERGARATAARVLVWKIACTSIARRDEAMVSARTFAGLELELPADVDAIPVEAHRILASALEQAEKAGKRELVVRTESDRGLAASGAKVTIDGRGASCVTECVVSLRPGDHLLQIEKDGFTRVKTVVRVDDAKPRDTFTAKLVVAPPEIAAEQWGRRYATVGVGSDSNESVSLLAQATRAQRFVYLESDRVGGGARLRGALAVQGKVEAREEKVGSIDKASGDVVEQLLVKGGVVENKSLVQKPLFWVVVGVVALGSSALTAYALYDPGSRTVVETR